MPRNEKCETCRFWEPNDDDSPLTSGECRRYPPTRDLVAGYFELLAMARNHNCDPDDVSTEITGAHLNVHPETTHDDWCGEWQAAEPQEPQGTRERVQRLLKAIGEKHLTHAAPQLSAEKAIALADKHSDYGADEIKAMYRLAANSVLFKLIVKLREIEAPK